MAQRYDVVLDSPLGQRFGTLVWTEHSGIVQGTLSLLGFENPVNGQRTEKTLELTHRLRTAVSTLTCRTLAQLHGDELSGVVTSERCRMELRGRKAAERSNTQHEISAKD